MATPPFDPNSNEILTDPEFLFRNPGWVKQAHDLLVSYGILPAGGDFADAATAQEIRENPYSVAALLGKGLQTTQGTNMNTANAHGALFSGAYANSQLLSQDAYQRDLAHAGESLTAGLNAIGQQRTNSLVDIWQRLSSTPVDPNTGTPPPQDPGPAPLGVPGLRTGTATAHPTPQGPYIRTGPEAGSVANQVKIKPPGARGGQAVPPGTGPRPVSYTGRPR